MYFLIQIVRTKQNNNTELVDQIQAVELLKEDGVLVYSTCTFLVEENESLVSWALKSFPDLQLARQVRTRTHNCAFLVFVRKMKQLFRREEANFVKNLINIQESLFQLFCRSHTWEVRGDQAQI